MLSMEAGGLIVVFGATSRLGRVVVRALSCGGFRVRAVTRSPGTDGAAALSKLANVEVVTGSIYDTGCLDGILQGADGVFIHLFVDFDDFNFLFNVTRMGTALVEACRRAEIQHVVFHTALSPLRMLGISAKHWDARSEVEILFRQSGLHVTYLMVPVPYESFMDFLLPERISKDHFRIAIPIGTIPIDLIALDDVGEPVLQIFLNSVKFRKKTVALSAGKMTAKNICDTFSHHFSPFRFTDRQVTHREFRDLKFKGSVDWSHAFEFLVRTDQQYSKRTAEEMNSDVRSLSQWLKENHSELLNLLNTKS